MTFRKSNKLNPLARFACVVVLFVSILLAASCKDDNDAPSAKLEVMELLPATGASGTDVTIKGSGFVGNAAHNIVTFNGKPAFVKSATKTALTVTVPEAAGVGEVRVKIVNEKGEVVEERVGPSFDFIWTYLVTTLAGGTQGNKDGVGKSARFNEPRSVFLAQDGNLYVADMGNFRIRKVNSTGIVTTFAGSEMGDVNSDDPLKAKFGYVSSIAQDAAGNLYITEERAIRKIDTQGRVTTLAGSATAGAVVDGTGASARFIRIQGMIMAPTEDLYAADVVGNVIRKITTTGVVTTVAGTSDSNGLGYQDGPVANAKFVSPKCVLAAPDGSILIADLGNGRIRKLSDGNITTFSGAGTGYSDGIARQALLGSISFQMAMDNTGNIYLADADNSVIRRIDAKGDIITIAGAYRSLGIIDGTGANARFNQPSGIVVDGDGNLLVADAFNHAIRKITLK